ncbi:30S ribosomal protein S3 [Spatholobus suberectus]|nr:30S ribosomal protein S3 [Spatholobus suberectus]
MNMQKKLNYVNRKLNIAIARVENAYKHPNILTEFIAGKLKNRVLFRKAMKKAIELTEQAGTKGVQIQLQDVSTEKKLRVLSGFEKVHYYEDETIPNRTCVVGAESKN